MVYSCFVIAVGEHVTRFCASASSLFPSVSLYTNHMEGSSPSPIEPRYWAEVDLQDSLSRMQGVKVTITYKSTL